MESSGSGGAQYYRLSVDDPRFLVRCRDQNTDYGCETYPLSRSFVSLRQLLYETLTGKPTSL